jgi:metal-responsive CopG/Arc/MetJ family transcriptional regulator
MKTAISIPDDLFRTADKTARKLGLSRSALIQRALIDFLESQNQKSIVEKLNKVYSKIDSSIPMEIQEYQRSTIQKEDW